MLTPFHNCNSLLKIGRIHNLFLVIIIFFVSCQGQPDKKQNDQLPTGSSMYAKYGCMICHSLDGGEMYGPPLNDNYMKKETVIRKSRVSTISTDRKYLRRAIIDPGYEKVWGYQDRTMPLPDIPREDVEILVDYLIGLDKVPD